jgi:hypothetical protein
VLWVGSERWRLGLVLDLLSGEHGQGDLPTYHVIDHSIPFSLMDGVITHFYRDVTWSTLKGMIYFPELCSHQHWW